MRDGWTTAPKSWEEQIALEEDAWTRNIGDNHRFDVRRSGDGMEFQRLRAIGYDFLALVDFHHAGRAALRFEQVSGLLGREQFVQLSVVALRDKNRRSHRRQTSNATNVVVMRVRHHDVPDRFVWKL